MCDNTQYIRALLCYTLFNHSTDSFYSTLNKKNSLRTWCLAFFLVNQYEFAYNTSQQKNTFFWSRMVFLTRCCIQIFPKLNSFPVTICWNFQNCKFSLTHFFLTGQKNYCLSKKNSTFLHILEWNCVLNTMFFSAFPKTTQFSRIFMLILLKQQIFDFYI